MPKFNSDIENIKSLLMSFVTWQQRRGMLRTDATMSADPVAIAEAFMEADPEISAAIRDRELAEDGEEEEIARNRGYDPYVV